ncbi:MAG: peptide chain release factor N(5)-glutamine methyltransferase [Epsilonproteobacteria bacterium]|nr:peptide chain release factor N(5)-glutamine methyltransferase [Campylobacterota bacterium]
MRIREFLNEPDGSYILEKVLNKDRAWLFLHDDMEVPKDAVEILQKVKSGYPIEYIFEEVWFYGERFYVKEGVLIPRDDTEVVLDRAIQLINEKCKVKSEKCKVVDCCTGSGVIAIEISKHTYAKVIATDISDTAIEVAEKNIALHNVDVEIKKCDLLSCEGKEIKADILVSNPPYVENSWKKPNEYEPDLAFYGGDDGLDIVKELINKAKKLKYKACVIEIGYNQKELLSKFLKDKTERFEFFNDLAGNVRGVEIIFE